MLISLIIPTRERATYLAECVRTATAIDDPGIEIVVSDNASTDGTAEVMAAQRDPRIVSLRTDRRVSMRQNFEFALERSRGDYVIFIGDDDGFLPRQFPALRMILERERPEVFTWQPLTYGWPIPGFGKRVGGVRFHRTRAFAPPRHIDLLPARARLLRADLAELGPTPSIYHGCASRAHLERMRGAGGHVFGARSPDVYLSYHTVLSCRAFLHSRHPFSVNGYSPVSTGNASHAYASSDPRSRPASRFVQEALQDPVTDAIRTESTSLHLNLLASFETARITLAVDPREVDYASWYAYVRHSAASDEPEGRRQVESAIELHARENGQGDALERSRATRPRRRRFVKFTSKLASHLGTIKCSAAQGNVNTVCTAAALADEVLADEYLAIIQADRPDPRAWPRSFGRALRRKFAG